jgi:phage terminase large subunit-like protein
VPVERAARERNGQRASDRCAATATVETDSNENLKPSKKWSTERIDLVSALVNPLAVALPAATGSIYCMTSDRRWWSTCD